MILQLPHYLGAARAALKRVPNLKQHTFPIRMPLAVPKPMSLNVILRQESFSIFVSSHNLRRSVLKPVQLNSQARQRAVEIEEVPADRVLASKFEPSKTSCSQGAPQLFFFGRLFAAKSPSHLRWLHGAQGSAERIRAQGCLLPAHEPHLQVVENQHAYFFSVQGQGKPNKDGPPLPGPLLHFVEEREKTIGNCALRNLRVFSKPMMTVASSEKLVPYPLMSTKPAFKFAMSLLALCALSAAVNLNAGETAWFFPRLNSGNDLKASHGLDETPPDAPQQRGGRFGQGGGRVFKDRINPHWFANNTRFWYRNDLRSGTKEFILVDAERGRRSPAFDHAKLAAALSKASGTEYVANKLPFDSIDLGDGSDWVRFKAEDTAWQCDLGSYECAKIEASLLRLPASEPASGAEAAPQGRGGRGQRGRGAAEAARTSGRSPDGKWNAVVKDQNIFVKSTADEAKEIQLSSDGKEGLAYGRLSWAPDSKTLVAFRIGPGERKEVYLVQSSPPGGGRAKLQTRAYDLPGDKLAQYELNLFHIADRKQLKPEVDRFEHGWETPRVRWHRDGGRFAYQQVDRGHQRFRVIEVDAQTGQARNIIDEKSETFIWTAHAESLNLAYVNWLEKSEEIIYASERDGWRHLYLIDVTDGKIKNQITRGEYVVRGIDRIDEEARQIWFSACGKNPDQDPYFIHHYRVNFDGTDLIPLTESNGNHTIQYSPDRTFVIDTYSRTDRAPAHELRRVLDGQLVCQLEEADISELKTSGWEAPEVFVAKGRDGKTDIWGVISRPRNFDPSRKYPVIEDIYAGPQSAFVPKTFSPARRYAALNDLGFIVVKIDGMGTAHRSKAFHDVCFKNLKDAGFPDRILWMKAAANKYPYMDLTRVGAYGTSAGGQNAAAAVLFHPEFYKVAVANCGCHDNRMDKASWNEQWMSYPVGPQYSECSNIDNAHRLQGKLFLIVGELDTNVPPESTLRFADALIKAGKDFDLLVVPGTDHGIRGPQSAYAQRRQQDFFVRHLLGKEPPDRNAQKSEPASSKATGTTGGLR